MSTVAWEGLGDILGRVLNATRNIRDVACYVVGRSGLLLNGGGD